MLVLTRKANAGTDSILVIGDSVEDRLIEVTVLEVQGDSVKLGITAPHNVVVDRCEIWEQKQGEKRQEFGNRGLSRKKLA